MDKSNPPNCYSQLTCTKMTSLANFNAEKDCKGCQWNMSKEEVHELVKSLNNMVYVKENCNG